MQPFQIPSTVLDSMRQQAQGAMSDAITIYNITYEYDLYGKQVPVSGIYTETVGLLAKPMANDWDRLRATYSDGVKFEQTRLLLLPYNVLALNMSQVVRTHGKDWRIIEYDADTTPAFRVYTKLIIARNEYAEQPEDIT